MSKLKPEQYEKKKEIKEQIIIKKINKDKQFFITKSN